MRLRLEARSVHISKELIMNPLHSRLRVTICVSLLLSVALVVGAIPAYAQGNGHPVKVMTQNLYQGTDYQEVLGAAPQDFTAAVDTMIYDIKATNPAARMHAVAMEIAAEQPDIVAVQEATTWYLGTLEPFRFGPEIDMLGMLTADLKSIGSPYKVVVHQDGFQVGLKNDGSQLPPFLSASGQLIGTNMQLAILVRDDLFGSGFKIVGSGSGVFETKLPMPVLTYTVPVIRTWAYIDVNDKGHKYRFVTAHPEAFHNGVLMMQVGELLAGPANVAGPVIIAADLNIPANRMPVADAPLYSDDWLLTMAYQSIVGAGFTDAYKALYPSRTGFTCCQANDLMNGASMADERIDVIFTKDAVPFGVKVVGGKTTDMVEGVWPSDHAGLIGKIKVK